jgi:hypothetical protein
MVASIVMPDDLRKLDAVVDAYVGQWLTLMAEGLPAAAADDADWQNLPEHDRRNRAAIFSPRTNPVWMLLDRLVGQESAESMRNLLLAPAER